MTPYVLMIALGMHACFEGIACGLMSKWAELINLMIAIFLHKSAASISLAISLQRNFNDFSTLLKLMIVFASATPIGVTIGIILAQSSKIVEVIFSSLAGGTFIYISCSELIVEEFSLPGKRWIKYFAFLIGAAIITLLGLLGG